MPLAVGSPLPPMLVGHILHSLKQGSLGELENALDRAAGASSRNSASAPDVQERLELIDAIAAELRSKVRRSPGVMPTDGVDVFVPLLEHLAAGCPGFT